MRRLVPHSAHRQPVGPRSRFRPSDPLLLAEELGLTPRGPRGYSGNGSSNEAGGPMPPFPRPPLKPARAAPDPFGFRRRREQALVDWEADPSPEVAFRIALWTGYCLLSGSGGASLPPLPVPVVRFACGHLAALLSGWIAEIESSNKPAEEVLLKLMEDRTDTWAVMEAIRRTEADLRDRNDRDAPDVTRAFEPLFELLDGFDAALVRLESAFRELASHERVKALRAMLSPRFRTPPPWWLEV